MDPGHIKRDCHFLSANVSKQTCQQIPVRNFSPSIPRVQENPEFRPSFPPQNIPFNQAQSQPQRNFQPGNPPFRPNNATANLNPALPRQNPRRPLNQNSRPAVARINQVQAFQEEDNHQAHIHAAIEYQRANQQFSVLQTPGEYEGKPFTLLIDFGSTHSFLSPRCIRNLNLHEHPDSNLMVELATGKKTRS